jgi:predicted amidohydrolase YtcJ
LSERTDTSRSISRRQFLHGAAAATATGLVPASGALAHGRGRRAADLIVYNGKVHTMRGRFQAAQAVAIRNGRILAVGRNKELRHLAGRRTEWLDAGGGTVLPGINDSHLHLNAFGLSFPPYSFSVNTATIEELVAVVRDAVAQSAPGAWIRGRDWNDNRLPRAPRASDLDPVSPNNPVVLTDFSFHATSVNSVVMRLAGITRDTQPPPGGVIEKDANGEPTGVFRETAQALVRSVVPPFTPEEVSTALDSAIGILHAQGITSVTDPGIGLGTLDLYADKHRGGELPVRVTVLLSGGPSPNSVQEVLESYRPIRDLNPLKLRVAGVKLFADGIPTAAKTAWLHEPYLDGTNGSLVIEGASNAEQVANLHEMIRRIHVKGFQIGTHATGDATIDAVVAGYLRAMRHGRRRRNPRHYVIHADLTPPRTLRRMARAGIGANMNATIKYLLGRTLDPILGPERTDYQWPYRTALDAGVRVSSASDAPVTFPSWQQGVMAAMLREGMFGGVAGEAERISLPEALHTYTSTPAWQDFAERVKGTLERGNVADVCVLDQDLRRVDPHDFVNVPVNATIFSGRLVFERAGARAASRRGAAAAAAKDRAGHGIRCYERGKCCCVLNEELRAGLV